MTRSTHRKHGDSKRARQLAEHPLCEYVLDDGTTCSAIADTVHHIIPIEDGGSRRDPENLRSMCASHHAALHGAGITTPTTMPFVGARASEP
jgi:5-methylcytosine-specific restriction endonuclease McrA